MCVGIYITKVVVIFFLHDVVLQYLERKNKRITTTPIVVVHLYKLNSIVQISEERNSVWKAFVWIKNMLISYNLKIDEVY